MTFLQWWIIVGIASVIWRNKMVWQEEHKEYRLTLILLAAPAMIALNVLSGSASALVRYAKFTVAAYEGVDPSSEPKKEKENV